MKNTKVTFWKSDFKEESIDWLMETLKAYAAKGIGCWFATKTNFIDAFIPEDEYEFIMSKVATY